MAQDGEEQSKLLQVQERLSLQHLSHAPSTPRQAPRKDGLERDCPRHPRPIEVHSRESQYPAEIDSVGSLT